MREGKGEKESLEKKGGNILLSLTLSGEGFAEPGGGVGSTGEGGGGEGDGGSQDRGRGG